MSDRYEAYLESALEREVDDRKTDAQNAEYRLRHELEKQRVLMKEMVYSAIEQMKESLTATDPLKAIMIVDIELDRLGEKLSDFRPTDNEG